MIDQPSSSFLSASSTINESGSRSLRARYARYFFVGMAVTFIIVTVLGFTPDYIMLYTPGANALRVHWFSHFHGALMASWLLLFLTQTILVVKGNVRFHRQLGLWSVTLGIIIWITMVAATVRPKIAFPLPIGDFRWDVLLIALYGIILFGLFFAWGMLSRKNLTTHKRLMLLATIGVMQASVDRVRFLPFIQDAFFVRFVYLDLLLIPLFIYDLIMLKRIHKITWIGSALFLVLQVAMVTAAGTTTWQTFAFNMFAPFVDPVVEVKLTAAQVAPLLGDYGDENWHVTISQDNGKFYLKLPDVPIFEMGPTSESEMSLKTVGWRVSFVKDANGNVTKIINNEPDLTWELRKMKD